MQPMANMALRAARLAGKHIARAFDRPDTIKISEKGPNDFVTNIDKEAEQIIIESLKSAYPHHSFAGEENMAESVNAITDDKADFQWVIDPIDGTANFIRNIPHFCISIACIHKGRLEHGVIMDPLRLEEFVASRGTGCSLNGRRVRVRRLKDIQGAMISTGGRENREVSNEQGSVYSYMLNSGATMRQSGSAALDLAYVAAGRLDAMWMRQLSLWDMAAGALMVQEAGGLLGDFDGSANHLKTGNIIAASPKVFKFIAPAIRKSYYS
jgi:myo-inositol-1(or 4)-monophosphatase